MKYLSIDPATEKRKKQAWASFEDRTILSYGRCTLDELNHLIQAHDSVFCEDQYVAFPYGGKTREWRAKVQGVINLAHTAGQIERMAKTQGKQFQYVDPGTWQARILGAGPGVKAAAREETAVKMAKMYIKTYLGEKEAEKRIGVDIGCAICIGICGIGQIELDQLKERRFR